MMGKGDVDGSRTVDCLRGRLLAERVASMAAKDEAEFMSKRLTELERLLASEIKARNRAEKRLKRVVKKLESLKIMDAPGRSNASEGSGSSSSSASFSSNQMREERDPNHSQTKDHGASDAGEKEEDTRDFSTSEDLGDETLDGDLSADSVDQSVSQEGSWFSVGTAHSHNKGIPCSGEPGADASRESQICGEELDGAKHQIEHANGALTLVPAKIWPSSESASEPHNNSINVQGVLVALRHVKEQLQNSMGRRVVACSPNELYGL